MHNGVRYPRVGGTRYRRFDGTSFKPHKLSENAATPTRRVHAVLLECHGWGAAVVSCGVERHHTGMPTGAHRPDVLREEHLGRPSPPMGLEPVVLLGRPVDTRLGHRARIGVYHSMPEIHAPPTT
jgi:hypothetical protein